MTLLALLFASLSPAFAVNRAVEPPRTASATPAAPKLAAAAVPAVSASFATKAPGAAQSDAPVQANAQLGQGAEIIAVAATAESGVQAGVTAGRIVFEHGRAENSPEGGICGNCGLSRPSKGVKLYTVGVIKEIKGNEKRVGLTPKGVAKLRHIGIKVLVERGAGEASGFSDEEYAKAGATLVGTAAEVFAGADLIKHVKELQPSEYAMLRPDHVVFTYNHFEEDEGLTQRSVDSKATFVSYEKVIVDGKTPLLAPMSRIAGLLAAQWTKPVGKNVVILGGGVAGEAAAKEALAQGATRVTITEFSQKRREQLQAAYPDADVLDSQAHGPVLEALKRSDVIVGSVYVMGKAPTLLGYEGQLEDGKPVPFSFEEITAGGKTKDIVDISVDQGGNAAWVTDKDAKTISHSKTSHDQKFAVDAYGNRLYRVPNMPAAMPRKASIDLEEATLPYLSALAQGVDFAVKQRPELGASVSISDGRVRDPKVAKAHAVEEPKAAPQPEGTPDSHLPALIFGALVTLLAVAIAFFGVDGVLNAITYLP